jgi:hypothetical protein
MTGAAVRCLPNWDLPLCRSEGQKCRRIPARQTEIVDVPCAKHVKELSFGLDFYGGIRYHV